MAKRRDTPPSGYKVGYKNPPLHSQFTKGQSGNPKGRKTKHESIRDLLDKVFGQKIPFTVNGVTAKRSIEEIALLQLGKKMMVGDVRAIKEYASLKSRFGRKDDEKERQMVQFIIQGGGEPTPYNPDKELDDEPDDEESR